MIEFLVANWLWIVFIALFVAMHRGGHGCGMHGRRDQPRHTSTDQIEPPETATRDADAGEPRTTTPAQGSENSH